MRQSIDRRAFLKLAGLGGAVFASGLAGGAKFAGAAQDDFYFVQLSDTHWGFNGPVVNPDAGGTLPKAVAAVNSLEFERLRHIEPVIDVGVQQSVAFFACHLSIRGPVTLNSQGSVGRR